MAARSGTPLQALAATLGAEPSRVLTGLAAVALVVVTLLGMQRFGVAPDRASGDPWNYLAAGERLNAGHPLYALSEGDRDVELRPPYWSTPLLSPPFIAVLWRPLALAGDVAMLLWWIGGVAAMSWFVVRVLARTTAGGVLGLVLLSPALVFTALSGNAAAYLIPLLALRHPAAVALATGVKLTPVLLAPAVGILRVLPWAVAVVMVSLLGAGMDNHLAWMGSMLDVQPTPISVAGLTGLHPVLVLALAALASLRGWSWAVVAVVIASPSAHFASFGLLAAALPMRSPEAGRDQSARSPRAL